MRVGLAVAVAVEVRVGVTLESAAGLRVAVGVPTCVAVGEPACGGDVLTGVGTDLVVVAVPGVRVAVPVPMGGVEVGDVGLPATVGVMPGGAGTVGGGSLSAAGKYRLISRPKLS